MDKFFKVPFASAGDVAPIPDAVDGAGNVSFTQGYGPDYQRQKTDPLSKNIERDKNNWLYGAITEELGLLQRHGVPDFITTALNGGVDPHEYGIGDIVRYLGDIYASRVAANVDLPSVAASWSRVRFGGIPRAVAGGTGDAVTVDFSPDLGALQDGDPILIQHTAANTGAVTIDPDTSGALSAYKGVNVALAAGDIAGANYWGLYVYDESLNKLQMLNPATGVNVNPTGINQGYTSAPLTLSAGAGFTMAHGMTLTPKLTEFEVTMTAAQANWAIGDTFFTPSMMNRPDTTATGFAVSVDATNIYLRVSSTSSLACVNKTTGAPSNLDYTNFTLIVRAYA